MATLNARFTVYTGLASQWTFSNLVLLKGEIGLETDTGLFKFGDGVNLYSALNYANNIEGEFGDMIANYYNKAEIDSKVDDLQGQINIIPRFKITVVEALPQTGDSATLYLLKNGSLDKQSYAEYIYVDGVWEKLGDHNLDLSNYYTKQEVNDLIAEATTDIPATEIVQDATHRFVSDTEKNTWNAKQDALTFDSTPTASSSNPVTSGGVKTALDSLKTSLESQINTKTANVVKYTDSEVIINGGELN